MSQAEARTSAELVLEAAEELHSMEQAVTRETIRQHTGLKQGIIDDRLKHLAAEGMLIRTERGVYRPLPRHKPARPISHTELPDGTVVLDIGDEVLHLTPKEARTLGAMLGCRALQASQIELGNQATAMATELFARLRKAERELKALKAAAAMGDTPQMGLDIAAC